MKALNLVMFSVALIASSAYADNYVCETFDRTLGVQVIHTIVAGDVHQTGNQFELFNPKAPVNYQLLAVFTPVDEILVSDGAEYLVRPTASLMNPEAAQVYLGATPLTDLASIELHIDSSNPTSLLDPAILTLQRLDGSEVQARMACARK